VRVARATDAAHPAGGCGSPNPSSGWLLEGPRRGTRPACSSGWVRRGGTGPGCRGAAGRSGQRSREQREEEGEEGERADVRALAGRGRKGERALGLGRSWASACAGPREEKEREERKPEGEKGSGPAWPIRKEEG
jgi:hypothetical protein